MPDNSIGCVLGRLEEAVSHLKADIAEIKTDHKDIKRFVDDQRNLYKYFWMGVSLLGSIVYFGRDIYDFIMKVKPH